MSDAPPTKLFFHVGSNVAVKGPKPSHVKAKVLRPRELLAQEEGNPEAPTQCFGLRLLRSHRVHVWIFRQGILAPLEVEELPDSSPGNDPES